MVRTTFRVRNMEEESSLGRRTHVIECRSTAGVSLGGSLAFPGTISEAQHPDIIVVAMSSSSRHITKPICQITYSLRNAGLEVSVLVLSSGGGTPQALAPRNTLGASIMSVTPQESIQISRHRLAIIHVGNVPLHFIPKIKEILKDADVPALVISQASITFDDLAAAGIRTPSEQSRTAETKGIVVELVNGIVRGQRCAQEKIDEIITKAQWTLKGTDHRQVASDKGRSS
jgi:methyl-coenzyme M reductase subunit C